VEEFKQKEEEDNQKKVAKERKSVLKKAIKSSLLDAYINDPNCLRYRDFKP